LQCFDFGGLFFVVFSVRGAGAGLYSAAGGSSAGEVAGIPWRIEMKGERLPPFLENYFSVQDVAAHWRKSEWWVREQVRNGEFRDVSIEEPTDDLSVIDLGGEIRISASALNRYCRSHVHVRGQCIPARNRGEALRKLNEQRRQGIPAGPVIMRMEGVA
jgi:hypothetical protein